MREALLKLRNLIEEYPVVIALLPTGYGKSCFFQYNPDLINKFNKIVHVLPLRAIVSELAHNLRKQFGDTVGYQAGIYIEDVNKTTFLANKYTIVTFDSFFMNFYGIPVSEIWRSVWHSDVAFLLSRISNTILDETHLVVTPSEIDNIKEEFSKIFLIIRDLIKWNINTNLKTIIFTATFYPWIFNLILPSEAYNKTCILIYAPENHEYVVKIKEICSSVAEIITIWSEKDDFYLKFKGYIDKVPTYLHYVSIDNFINNISKYELGDKVALMFNSVKRCIDTYERYHKLFEKQDYVTTILHGQMTSYARRNTFNILNNTEKFVLFSTQVIEAGVNLDFNTLITEVAPPHALIQRTGRVARHSIHDKKNYSIHIILGDSDFKIGVNKYCKGIYDIDLTISTISYLEKYANKTSESYIEVPINWRLPQINEQLDYLKLLMVRKDIYDTTIVSATSSFIEYLTKWRGSATTTLKQLDEYLKGSFIRSSTLFPLYLGPVDIVIEETIFNELIDKYVITLDTSSLKYYGNYILDFQKNEGRKHVKLVIIVDDEYVFTVNGPTLESLLQYPLYSLHRTISRIRRDYKEEEGRISRIHFLGLKANPTVAFNVERGYIYYGNLCKI